MMPNDMGSADRPRAIGRLPLPFRRDPNVVYSSSHKECDRLTSKGSDESAEMVIPWRAPRSRGKRY